MPGTNQTIRQWEAAHYDLILGGRNYAEYQQAGIPQTSYSTIRYQIPFGQEVIAMRDYAKQNNFDYESYFIHFLQDTEMGGISVVENQTKFPNSFNNNVGYDLMYDQNWFFGKNLNDSLYLGYFERFTDINFNLTAFSGPNWQAIWEYSAGKDSTGNVSTWKPLTIISDGTNGMKQNGKIKFFPPADWITASVNNSGWDSAPDQEYFVRLRVIQADLQYPQGTGHTITTTPFYLDEGSGKIKIYAFDSAADLNSDGYLDDTEWARHDPTKNARFKWWSRLPGRNFDPVTSWKINPGGVYKNFEGQFYTDLIAFNAAKGINIAGPYWDEFWTGEYFPWGETIVSGGTSDAYNDPATRDAQYKADLLAVVQATKDKLGPSRLFTANLATGFGRDGRQEIENAMDVILAELYTYTFSGYNSIVDREPQIVRVNNLGKKLVIQGQIECIDAMGGGTVGMDRAKNLPFLHYLMVQNPNNDYFLDWQGDYYASGSADNPRPVNYFPQAATLDFGVPTYKVPSGFSNAKSNTSGIFDFASGPVPGDTAKTYKILGRDYTKALVLDKPLPDGYTENQFLTQSATWGDATATIHNLPTPPDNPSGRYYRVNYDGSISTTPITSISLRNGDGAILIKETALNSLNLIKTVDKSNAQSGDILTYSVTYQNGVDPVTAAVINDPIPSGTTYVNGSASNSGTFDGTKIIWNIGDLATNASGTVTFQVRIL